MTPRVLENTSWDAALIPAYIYMNITMQLTKQLLHVENTSWDVALIPAYTYFTLQSIHHNTISSLISAHAGNLVRAGGLGSPLNSISQALGNSLHDSPGLPCYMANDTASQLPRKGGYPQLQGRG